MHKKLITFFFYLILFGFGLIFCTSYITIKNGFNNEDLIFRSSKGKVVFSNLRTNSGEPYEFCTTIVINEIYAGGSDWVEMYNYGPDWNMTGWYLEIYDGNYLELIYNFPDDWVFKNHQIVVLHESSTDPDTETDLYTGDNIPWHNRPIAIGLFDDDGVNLDWFQTSTHIANIPSDAVWNQDVSLVISDNYAYRIHDIDNNRASDWIATGSGSQGNLNPGQTGEAYPCFHNLIKSEDPLELGNTEIITIDIYDLEGINQAQIEIDNTIYPMTKLNNFTWQYDSWTPTTIGFKSYTIYAENLLNNINNISDSIEVIDTTSPLYSNLVESADPLKLGATEIISINAYDISGINHVLIEIEGANRSMMNIGGDTWQYDSWIPLSIGKYPYTIYMEDMNDNWNSINESITVVDESPPSYSALVESADPLELGNTEVISIDVLDPSGVNQVIIEFEGYNHSMVNIGGITWQYDSWTPSSLGIYNYTIYMEDNNNNWGSISGSIKVVEEGADITPPSYSNLKESADPLKLGNTEIISIDVTDPSGVNQVNIEFEGLIHSMINIGGDTWQYDSWIPLSIGKYPYTIYMEDMNGNWNSINESITVVDERPPSYSDLVESADPLELGNNEVISINAYDESGINQVLIEIDESNHSMINIGGNTWQYDAWVPSYMGKYYYTIYIEDLDNNWIWVNDSIVVVDTTPPEITISKPKPYDQFGITPPDVNISFFDYNLEDTWYQLDNGTIATINNTWMGIIEQNVWDQVGNGTVILLFFANDSIGNLASDFIVLRKDIIDPQITIIEPHNYELFGINPPDIEINIVEPNLLEIWYQLTDGTHSVNHTWFWSIDQDVWNLYGNGLVTITFYVNDSVGNLGFHSVIVSKDITAPDIIINSPDPYDVFGKIPPNLEVVVNDPNLDNIWYELFNITISISDFTWDGVIEQSIWDVFKSDILTIRFYANDTLGNTRFLDVTILKDITPPDIKINNPDFHDLFGAIPPNIDIHIFDDNLDYVWYQLSNGIITTSNHTWTGFLDQSVWNEIGNGTVDIIFYANDTLSNFAINHITVRKDLIAPLVFIDYPSNNTLFGNTPPNIIINAVEQNLDTIWYQIENGTTITGKYLWTGIIDHIVWDEIGNGTVIISFFVNDTVGNLASETLIVRKDIIAPEIIIESPYPYDLFGKLPPIINVEFNDPHLSNIWYQLKNGTITTLNNTWTGTIEQNIWNQVGNGTIMILLYANDSVGNLGIKVISIHKDILAPKIIINYPNPYDIFGESAPDINVIIDDKNLNKVVYQLKNESLTTLNYTWTGALEQSVWDEIGNGTVIIVFYAYDLVGNMGHLQIIILKDLSAPLINIIEPEEFTIFGQNSPEFKVYISGVDIHNCWYTLLGKKYFFTRSDGITSIKINQTKWDEFGNGTIIIEFYVNDSVGNIGLDIIKLRKDIFAPQIRINLPIYEGYWNTPPILNISFFDPNFDSLWYTIGTISVILKNNTEQMVDFIIWNNLAQGEFQIYIFANDTAGNINNTYRFVLFKDTFAPLININLPINNTYNNIPPSLNIACFDPNFDTLWYRIGNSNILLDNNSIQSLEWEIWDNMPDGLYYLFLYANDTFGHLNDLLVFTLYKDTTAPEITIYSPINNIFYSQPPIIDIYAIDPNLHSLWYEIGEFSGVLQNHLGKEIDKSTWDLLPQGEFRLYIYANDSFGYLNNSFILILYKDTLAPRIVINMPYNLTYWKLRPTINITVYDPNLDKIWYKIGTENSWLENNTETLISDYIWSNLPEGKFIVEIYAIDLLGQINNINKLILYKDTLAPDIKINYPYLHCFSGINSPFYNLTINEPNLDNVWYTLGNYSEKYIVEETSGTINQEAWENFNNGTVLIRFYANDTLGHISIKDITVRKDIFLPVIKIILPVNRTIWDSPPVIRILVSDSNLDSIWYKIGTKHSNLNNNITQHLNNLIWDNLPEGEFHIYFFANDTAGNINESYYVTLNKDTLAPKIIVNFPLEYQLVDEIAPYINLSIIDNNLDSLWYTLDSGLTNITFNENNMQIDQEKWYSVWKTSSNGDLISIRFYANDTLGHIAVQDVIIVIKKPSNWFELTRLTGITFIGTLGVALGITTTIIKTSKKFKRIDEQQQRKINVILYLGLTLISLLLLSFIF